MNKFYQVLSDGTTSTRTHNLCMHQQNMQVEHLYYLGLSLQMEQACPLHLAAKAGFVEGVIRLLEGYANLEAVDKNGLTPLLVGCRESKADVVSVLVEAGANVNHISFVSDLPLFLPLNSTNE